MRSLLAVVFILATVPYAQAQFDYQYQEGGLELSLGSSYSEPTDSSLVRYEIGDFGYCNFFQARGLRWQQRFADGSALEVRCERERGGIFPAFHLWFVDGQGSRLEIARCIFKGGM